MRTGGAEVGHMEEPTGQAWEKRWCAMERWRDRWRHTGGGEAAQLRENEDCLLGIGGGRASLGCYGIALPPHLCNYKSLDM